MGGVSGGRGKVFWIRSDQAKIENHGVSGIGDKNCRLMGRPGAQGWGVLSRVGESSLLSGQNSLGSSGTGNRKSRIRNYERMGWLVQFRVQMYPVSGRTGGNRSLRLGLECTMGVIEHDLPMPYRFVW